MAKKLTEADILEAYRAARGLSRGEFAHELGMSRQSYSTYLNKGVRQELEGLQESAVENVGGWIGDLAVDLLKARGAAIPCVCQTEMWDCGACPKHGSPLKYVIASETSAELTAEQILQREG